MKRVPIYPDIKISDYNNGNLHQYDPYIISDNKVILDKYWFSTLTSRNQTDMLERLDKLNLRSEFGVVPVPHPLCDDTPEKPLVKIYQSYLDDFDYRNWYHRGIPNGPKNVTIIYIDNDIKKILSEMYQNKHTSDERLKFFKSTIDKSLKSGEYFMRLSSTSGKNYKSVEPLSTSDEIIKRLVTVSQFNDQEYTRDKDTSLILIPWNIKIEKRNEFRIFIKDGKLTGASQQWWSQLFNYTTEELDNIETALNNIEFIQWVPYKTFIADVYIDEDKCKLIECNPFGAHCGAGSSLFNWVTDYEVLHGNGTPELRYLSVIKI